MPKKGQKKPNGQLKLPLRPTDGQMAPWGHTRGKASRVLDAAGQKNPTGHGEGVAAPVT